VGVSASKVKTALTEQGGSIEMEYALEIDHAVAGENTIQIDIRESGPNARMSAVPGTFIYDKYLN
jgi:uncharacterized beta-barrel protein YwiB (DUF1934 family)